MPYPIPEKLNYANLSLHMYQYPLEQYPDLSVIKSDDAIAYCWRGYVGIWQIDEDKKLYLTNLVGTLNSQRYKEITKKLRIDQARLFAGWFTGEIHCPMGKVLEYRSYQSLYEAELLMEFNEGVLTSEVMLQPISRKTLDD